MIRFRPLRIGFVYSYKPLALNLQNQPPTKRGDFAGIPQKFDSSALKMDGFWRLAFHFGGPANFSGAELN